MGHDLLTIYWLKAIEYILAISYLPLFVLFWRFVNPKAPALATVPAAEPGWAEQLAGFFRLPAELSYHPGHAWARLDGPDIVTVGIDDFAGRLVGPFDGLGLPRVGAELMQGEPAIAITSGAGSVDVLAPVNGTVLEVNEAVLASPQIVKQSPYGEGWLFRVRNPRLASNLKHLLSGDLARRWMDTVSEKLGADAAGAELGPVYLDGGVPVDGLARSLSPEHWDKVARRYLLTEEGGSNA